MGRRRGGLRGGSRRRMATGSGGGCVPAAARPTGGKAGRGEHQGGQAAVGRAVLARGLEQSCPAAGARGEQRVRGGAAAKSAATQSGFGWERVEEHE